MLNTSLIPFATFLQFVWTQVFILIFIIFLIIGLSLCAPCPLEGSAAVKQFYYKNSQKSDNPQCKWYNENTCCKSNFDAQSVKVGLFDNPEKFCDDILNVTLCSSCSPDQDTFTSFSQSSGLFQVKLFKDLCSRVYDICKTLKLRSGGSVGDRYSSSDTFCSDVFSANNVSIITASGQCFNGGNVMQPFVMISVVMMIALLVVL